MYLPDHALVNTTLGRCGDLPSAKKNQYAESVSRNNHLLRLIRAQVYKLKFGTMNMWFLLNPPGKATIHVANVNSLMQHMRLNSTLAMRSVLVTGSSTITVPELDSSPQGGNHNPADDIPGATCVFCKSSEGMKLTGSY
ncbi:hypothetical protein DY000_02026684 [Brassica cretica]|uniref:Uncharacterized protein n=1 Tax=Brassica cretica TaxID=69181 RepID=A0ABQ7ECT0_BRACR|nr:hypothetical protein DY000_02026684 [Brassica cretica]